MGKELARSLVSLGVLVALAMAGLAGAMIAAGAQGSSGPVTVPGTVPAPVREGRATPEGLYDRAAVLHLVIGLRPPQRAAEEQFLRQLQTRGSAQFHKYLTPSQWNSRYAPAANNEQLVVDWARAQGFRVTKRFPNRLTVDVDAPVGTVEQALAVKVNAYQLGKATYYSNDRDPTIPASLGGIVQSIAGLNNLNAQHPGLQGATPSGLTASGSPNGSHPSSVRRSGDPAKRPTANSGPLVMSGNVEVSDLWSSQGYSVGALYNQGHCCNPFHSPSSGAPNLTSIAIITACGVDLSDNGDLVTFANQYGLALNTTSFTVNGGPSDNSNCSQANGNLNSNGLETTLDAEVSNAMANSFGCYCDTAQVFVYEAPSDTLFNGGPTFNFGDNIDAWQQALNDDLARSASESWGCAEDSCWDGGDMDTLHDIFNQMTGQGWTVSASAGDSGAFEDNSTLSVGYPGSDPDIVDAGGTVLSLNSSGNFISETAWNGGGGGCSQHFSTPFYQTTYTASNGAIQNFNNPCGGSSRSAPDISLNSGAGQAMYFNGGWFGVLGTSIAAPEFAGLFANENAYLLSMQSVCGTSGNAACAPLGDPHQWIYFEGSEPSIFAPHNPYYDITSGCNNGRFNSGGYCAGTGFDLATGWGSFDALQFAWMFNWQFVYTDNHPPVVTYNSSPAPGWYNTDKFIGFSVSDPVRGGDLAASGVAGFTSRWDSDPGDPFSEPTPGCCNVFWNGPETIGTTGQFELAPQGQGCHTPNVRAWDNQGEDSGDQTTAAYCYDITPPTVHCASPDGLWHPTDVSLACTASDSLSGLANPADASFSLSTNVPAGTQTSNAFTNSHVVCDVAGNCVTAGPLGPNKVDKAPPTITIVSPVFGGTYLLNQAVAANYSCSDDAGSGVATCTGTVPSGSNIDTASVGTKIFSVNSTDNVGNASTQSLFYYVTYKICLVYDATKAINSGATFAFTLYLCDANGVNVSSAAITLTAISVTPAEPLVSPANPANLFRFDPVARQYIYNLSTKGYPSGSYVLTFTVSGDPITHSVPFAIK